MAVYTDVSPQEAEEFLTQYDIGTLNSLQGITGGVENSNFMLHTSQAKFILTLIYLSF
jgi:homoserine kinase type II